MACGLREFDAMNGSEQRPRPFPAFFFGHGNPMNAIEENQYSRQWKQIGASLGRPKAILAISAHWYTDHTSVTSAERPRTIHDFGGFPRSLYTVEYPAAGSPELARRVAELVGDCELDSERGLDHGTWSVLVHLFPDADVPVIQLSLDETKTPAEHAAIGRKLRPFRDEGVVVIGSGNVVHNLHTYAWGRESTEPFDWAERFDGLVREKVRQRDHQPLIEYETLGRDALLSIPTPDHYLPLLYVLGVRDEADEPDFPVEGIEGGSVSMLAVRFAQPSR
jgi:4,5-DOPA dioxygenase extradiol